MKTPKTKTWLNTKLYLTTDNPSCAIWKGDLPTGGSVFIRRTCLPNEKDVFCWDASIETNLQVYITTPVAEDTEKKARGVVEGRLQHIYSMLGSLLRE